MPSLPPDPSADSRVPGPRSARSDRWAALGALLLALAGTALVYDHVRLDSATIDETIHSEAGAEYAILGTYFLNAEHPPLAKLLAGRSMEAAGARPPGFRTPPGLATAESPQSFFERNAIPPDDLLAAARRPFPLALLALVAAAFVVASRWGGALAGLGAAALVAFEPNLVAHAGIVHTDVPVSLGFLATLGLALEAIRGRRLAVWLGTGVALGLTLAVKFSGVFLVPVLLLATLLSLLGKDAAPSRGATLRGLVSGFAVAGLVLIAVYAVAMRHMTRDEARAAVVSFLTTPPRLAEARTIERVLAVSSVSPPFGQYLAGLAGIDAQNRAGGGVNYLRGRLSFQGFPEYFLVAFLVKSSLGFLAALAAAIAVALRKGWLPGDRRLAVATFAGAALYLFLNGVFTSYNIGIRHMLPVYPLLAVAAAITLASRLPARSFALVVGLVATVQAAETLLVHPHELSFFNALSGGPSRGERWLNDSNLDWGQDLRRLGLELRRRGLEAETTVAYVGGGEPSRELPRARILSLGTRTPAPGVYAVSSFFLCAGPEILALYGQSTEAANLNRLRTALRTRGVPLGRVGYSIHLFRLPPELGR